MARSRHRTSASRRRNLASPGLGLTVREATALARRGASAVTTGAQQATTWATPRIQAGAAWAAPHLKAAAKEAAALTARGVRAADPHVRAGLKRVPREVWVGLGVATTALVAWWLWENRDRNPQVDKPTFVRKLWAALGNTTLGQGAKKLVIAQFALESGWGFARAAVKGFNYGNIARGPWTGPVTYAQDKHCIAGGAICVPIIQAFRKYGSDAEAIQDYFAFLGGGRYARSFEALQSGDLVRFATQLREDGYYTASVDVYVNGMQGAMSTINAALSTGPAVA